VAESLVIARVDANIGAFVQDRLCAGGPFSHNPRL